MKPLVQKLPLDANNSFVSRVYRTPFFEVPWHYHVEYEIIMFTEGCGMSFIGNYIGEYETGDIFFLSKNLPHTFQKRDESMINSAIVIQFCEDFWGQDFLELPESLVIKNLFEQSVQGLKVGNLSKRLIAPLIKKLENLSGFRRIIALCRCLEIVASKNDFTLLSTQEISAFKQNGNKRIDQIFSFTIDNFKKPIQLIDVAKIASMSVPAFCNYFKKCTKKTYIDFLNEIRIGYACRLLTTSGLNINEICYDSGFNSLANFNKQFIKIKKITPSAYRKQLV